MKRGKINKKTIIITVVLVLAAAAVAVPLERRLFQKSATQVSEEVEKEIVSYGENENSDGIVESTPDPYFIYKQPGYKYGDVETVEYYSDITGTKRHANVFLPADYDKNKEYPVLYLLHGYGGSYRTWKNKAADIIIQNLHYFENGAEMIVVCPDSNVNKEESVDGLSFWESIEPFDKTAAELVDNLMPYIKENYPVKEGRENTAVAGNSMGGRNALAAAYTYPGMFDYVGAFSSASAVAAANGTGVSTPLEKLSLPDGVAPFRLMFLCVGRSDDVCGNVSYELDEYMKRENIDHIFYDTEGGHETTVWQNALYNFAKKLFTD